MGQVVYAVTRGQIGCLAHLTTGALMALLWRVHWVLSLIACVLFLVYEVQEWLIIKDKAYRDMLECSAAFFTISALQLVLGVL